MVVNKTKRLSMGVHVHRRVQVHKYKRPIVKIVLDIKSMVKYYYTLLNLEN